MTLADLKVGDCFRITGRVFRWLALERYLDQLGAVTSEGILGVFNQTDHVYLIPQVEFLEAEQANTQTRKPH